MKIVTKSRPFSHFPGISCVIPGTCSILQAFPTFLRIDEKDYRLPFTGPVKDFTLIQDLERHALFISGHAQEGYFRLRIFASDSGFHIKSEKGNLSSFDYLKEIRFVPKIDAEKLSLGSHKAQNWDVIWKIPDLKTILPILFALGQNIPRINPQPISGTAHLLNLPKMKNDLEEALQSFLKASFTGMLVPRLFDDQYQGLSLDDGGHGDPFFLLQEGAKMVRDLFFQQNERRVSFLPNLPTCFDSGKMIGCKALGIGLIDFEWSKFLLRKVMIYPDTSGEILFDLQNEIKSFRVQKQATQSSKEPFWVEAGKPILIDQFKK